jgi:hypothetical protein
LLRVVGNSRYVLFLFFSRTGLHSASELSVSPWSAMHLATIVSIGVVKVESLDVPRATTSPS